MFKNAAQAKQPGGPTKAPPPAQQQTSSNTLAWVLGSIAAVAAVGSVAYFATRKPQAPKENPSKMSGYKSLEAAVRHAAALACEKGTSHYVAPRSDGFHIEDEPPRQEWDDEYVQITPKGKASHWLLGKRGWETHTTWMV
jgi:hypothetical protein